MRFQLNSDFSNSFFNGQLTRRTIIRRIVTINIFKIHSFPIIIIIILSMDIVYRRDLQDGIKKSDHHDDSECKMQ